MPTFSKELEQTLHRALALANEREHKYSTLEHLLLALVEDVDAAQVMRACKVDLQKLQTSLQNYIETEFEGLSDDWDREKGSVPTAGFQRVIQRAVIHVQASGREFVNGANVLVAIFAERESHAAYFLQEQDMTRYDAVNYISFGTIKTPAVVKATPIQDLDARTRQYVCIVSVSNDAAIENWLSDVLASANIEARFFRKALKLGNSITQQLDDLLSEEIVIGIVSPDFRRSRLHKALIAREDFKELIDEGGFIPLVTGTPINTHPIGDIVQLELSSGHAEDVCAQLFAALKYSGPYQPHPEAFGEAVKRPRQQNRANGNKGQKSLSKSQPRMDMPGVGDFGWHGSVISQSKFPASDLPVGRSQLNPDGFFRDYIRLTSEFTAQIEDSNHSTIIKMQARLLHDEVSYGPTRWDPQTVDRRVRALSELLPPDACPMNEIIKLNLSELQQYQSSFRKIYPIIVDRDRIADTLEIPTNAPLKETNQIVESLRDSPDLIDPTIPKKLDGIIEELKSEDDAFQTGDEQGKVSRKQRVIFRLMAAMNSVWRALQNPPELVKKLESYQKLYVASEAAFHAVLRFISNFWA